MAPTVLADLAVMMSSSPEDVATRAMELILNKSPSARSATKRLLDAWRGRPGQDIARYASQVGGTDAARTDLQGFNEHGEAVVIFENKFWAGLTENQPGTYLDRLCCDDGILAFLVPTERVHLIMHELVLRIRGLGDSAVDFGRIGEAEIAHLTSGCTVAVSPWSAFIRAAGSALEAAEEYDNLADLRQLEGLVEKMGREGFRPFTSGDVTGDTPRLILRLIELVDSVMEQFLTRSFADKKGLKATSWRGSYGHYFRMHGYGCHIGFTPQRWAAHGGSPVWLRVSSHDWKFTQALRMPLCRALDDPSVIQEDHAGAAGFLLPIRIAEGCERDAVLGDMLRQLDRIAAALESQPEVSMTNGYEVAPPVEEDQLSAEIG